MLLLIFMFTDCISDVWYCIINLLLKYIYTKFQILSQPLSYNSHLLYTEM